MAFLSGNVTFLRFRVDGPNPRIFTEEHLQRLEDFQAGRQRIASADGIDVGWTASGHVLDTDFKPEKNIVNDMLSFDLRVDADKLPNDLLKAYYETDLAALAAQNPTGLPTAKQKREAKESARDRLETEARDGRFRKRKTIPVVWDATTNEVLFGATSYANIDRLVSLFQQTFGYGLDPVVAGNRAFQLAELNRMPGRVDDSAPAPFAPGASDDVAWIADDTSRDFLGNEFLLWLWYTEDQVSDTVALMDASEVTFMFARKLTLDCPRGETGTDTFNHQGPTRLPEAKRAAQSGKLPRRAGLTMVRHSQQYEFLLHAETLAVAGCRLPKPADDVVSARAKIEDRVNSIRELIQTIDLLYAVFIGVRLSPKWAGELASMQKWLAQNQRQAAA